MFRSFERVDLQTGKHIQDRISALTREISELQARWPAHSIPAAMLEKLDELEEALAAEKERLARLRQLRD